MPVSSPLAYTACKVLVQDVALQPQLGVAQAVMEEFVLLAEQLLPPAAANSRNPGVPVVAYIC